MLARVILTTDEETGKHGVDQVLFSNHEYSICIGDVLLSSDDGINIKKRGRFVVGKVKIFGTEAYILYYFHMLRQRRDGGRKAVDCK